MKMAVGFFRIHCFAVMADTADRKIGATARVEGLRLLTADSAAVLFGEWALHKNRPLEYSKGTTWDRMLQRGIQLLERFAQDDRVRVRQSEKNLQVKFTR